MEVRKEELEGTKTRSGRKARARRSGESEGGSRQLVLQGLEKQRSAVGCWLPPWPPVKRLFLCVSGTQQTSSSNPFSFSPVGPLAPSVGRVAVPGAKWVLGGELCTLPKPIC